MMMAWTTEASVRKWWGLGSGSNLSLTKRGHSEFLLRRKGESIQNLGIPRHLALATRMVRFPLTKRGTFKGKA